MTSVPDPSPKSVKTRKIRKGTFSCWECKRRKTRCEFRPGEARCRWCQGRKLSCRSQQFEPDDEADELGRRLDHFEDVVNELSQRSHQNGRRGHPYSMTVMPSVSSSASSLNSYLDSMLPPTATISSILRRGNFQKMPFGSRSTVADRLVDATRRPSRSAHPLEFARKLIQLGFCSREISASTDEFSQYVMVASRQVTSHDKLVESPAGLEILILEAIYHMTGDDAKAAWLVARRGIAIAQLMGLDKMPGNTSDFLPSIWLRLMTIDRYASLMLGLGHAVQDVDCPDCFVHSDADLDLMHVSVAGRIISRNVRFQRHIPVDYKETQEIDLVLRQVQSSRPHDWWEVPTSQEISDDHVDGANYTTSRLMTQMHQSWLLLLLHQPYLFSYEGILGTREQIAYSGSTLCAAGRGLLRCFLVARGHHRGILHSALDGKAYAALIALLFAHIRGNQSWDGAALAHQRPHDLNLVIKALGLLRNLKSMLSQLEVIDKLLDMEDECSRGAQYAWSRGSTSGLNIEVPFFGNVSMERETQAGPAHVVTELQNAPRGEQDLSVGNAHSVSEGLYWAQG